MSVILITIGVFNLCAEQAAAKGSVDVTSTCNIVMLMEFEMYPKDGGSKKTMTGYLASKSGWGKFWDNSGYRFGVVTFTEDKSKRLVDKVTIFGNMMFRDTSILCEDKSGKCVCSVK